LTQHRLYGTLIAEVGEVFSVPVLFLAPLSPAALERMKERYFAEQQSPQVHRNASACRSPYPRVFPRLPCLRRFWCLSQYPLLWGRGWV